MYSSETSQGRDFDKSETSGILLIYQNLRGSLGPSRSQGSSDLISNIGNFNKENVA